MPTWATVVLVAWGPVALGIGVLIGKSIHTAGRRKRGFKIADVETARPTLLPPVIGFALTRSPQARTARRWW